MMLEFAHLIFPGINKETETKPLGLDPSSFESNGKDLIVSTIMPALA